MTDHSDLIAVRCEGCGSAWTDADLARERSANPRLLSCCPERKPLTIDQWRARAEAQSLSLSEAREEIAGLRKALRTIAEPIVGTPIGDPWAFYADLQAVANAALVSGSREDG